MMNEPQKTPPWILTAFHVCREFSIDQADSPLDVPEGLSTPPAELSVSDFKCFADCNLTLGDVLGILLLCRALDGTPGNLFRRRAVTVIQSSLRSDYLGAGNRGDLPRNPHGDEEARPDVHSISPQGSASPDHPLCGADVA